MNRAIGTALGGIALAQALKVFKQPYKHMGIEESKRKLRIAIDPAAMLETGGMPSSHSCGVASLAAYMGFEKGLNSAEFALSTMLGLIVMYDAAGIRRHAGETAIQVNDLDEDVEQLAGYHPGIYHRKRSAKLKERLGHQPVEVLAGALLGMGIGAISYWLK